MLVERSYLIARAGLEERLAATMAERGLPLLKALDGAAAVSFGRGVERPDRFMLLIEWRDMAAHTAFTRLPVFTEFCELVAPFTTGGEMEHFEME